MIALMTNMNRMNMMKLGETIDFKNQTVKVVGFLNHENVLTQNYKPHYRIVVQDKRGVKWLLGK